MYIHGKLSRQGLALSKLTSVWCELETPSAVRRSCALCRHPSWQVFSVTVFIVNTIALVNDMLRYLHLGIPEHLRIGFYCFAPKTGITVRCYDVNHGWISAGLFGINFFFRSRSKANSTDGIPAGGVPLEDD